MTEGRGDFTSWLSYLENLRYAFQENPRPISRDTFLEALEGYQVAVSHGMAFPKVLPISHEEALDRRAWWELQIKESVKLFLIDPSATRMDSVKSVTLQYIDLYRRKQ